MHAFRNTYVLSNKQCNETRLCFIYMNNLSKGTTHSISWCVKCLGELALVLAVHGAKNVTFSLLVSTFTEESLENVNIVKSCMMTQLRVVRVELSGTHIFQKPLSFTSSLYFRFFFIAFRESSSSAAFRHLTNCRGHPIFKKRFSDVVR